MVIEVSAEQPEKAPCAILVIPFESVTLVRFLQESKANKPIEVTLSAIVTLVSAVHPPNAYPVQ